MSSTRLVLVVGLVFVLAGTTWAGSVFNGVGDNETDAFGYYYVITGGKFPTGTIPNGASGGTFDWISDDSAMGHPPIDTWHKDGWFADNAGIALTLKNGNTTVYDNNGIEDNTYGDYYNQNGSHGSHGLYRGYSMSNNFDWVYAGYFKIAEATTITQIIGYFDGNGGAADPVAFNPFNPNIAYEMNIWSNLAGLVPVNTGAFSGDVLASDKWGGSLAVSDTGVVRVFSDNTTDPIYRLTYTLANPITLQPGEYWFSHDAVIVPEPVTMLSVFAGVIGLGGYIRRRWVA